jgi:hypothetical protein
VEHPDTLQDRSQLPFQVVMNSNLPVPSPKPVQSTALQLSENRYIARRNFFNFFGLTCQILTLDGQPRLFVKLKAFKLKEDIVVHADASQQTPLLTIKARSIIDFAATYDVTDVMTGQRIGSWRRKGLKSIFKDEWELLDVHEQVVGHIKEDSALMAFLRRFLSNLIAQSYTIECGGQGVGDIKGTWNPFLVKYTVDLSKDTGRLDRRMALAGVVLLMTIEGKQN